MSDSNKLGPTRLPDQQYVSSLPNSTLDEANEDMLLAEAEELFSLFTTDSFENQLSDTAASKDTNGSNKPKHLQGNHKIERDWKRVAQSRRRRIYRIRKSKYVTHYVAKYPR